MALETEVERIVVRLIGDGSSYQRMIAQAQSSTKGMATGIREASNQVSGFGFGMRRFALQAMGALAPMVGAIGALGTAFHSVNLAAEAEQMEIAFGTMLRGVDLGKQMVKDLQDFAAATPFEMTTLQRATKLLLQFGTAGADVIPILRMIGDATGGTDPQKVMQMSLAFGQMSASGRLMGQDLLQMINAGFNPLQEMARTTGKSMMQLRDEQERGLITIEMVKNAFKTATSAGGQFEGLMEKMSKTTSGLFSTMKDDVGAAQRVMGNYIIEFFKLKDIMMAVSNAAQRFTDWLKGLSPEMQGLVAGLSAVTAAVAVLTLVWPLLASIASGWVARLVSTLDFVLGPINLIGLAVAGLVILWVDSVGGMANAWEIVKTAAQDFWEWIKPVLLELVELAKEAWVVVRDGARAAFQVAKDAVAAFGEFVASMWRAIAGDASITWTDIRDGIVLALQFAQFTLRNFGAFVQFTWTGIKLAAVQTWNFIRDAVVTVAAAIMGSLAYLGRYAGAMWNNIVATAQRAWNVVRAGWAATFQLETSFASAFNRELERLNAASRAFENPGEEAARAFNQGFESTLRALGILGADSPLVQQLRREFQAQADVLREGWEEFRRRRLQELGAPDAAAERAAYEAGRSTGQQFNRGVAREARDMDAVLRYSAEALSRLQDYMDRFHDSRRQQAGAAATAAVGAGAGARGGAGAGGAGGAGMFGGAAAALQFYGAAGGLARQLGPQPRWAPGGGEGAAERAADAAAQVARVLDPLAGAVTQAALLARHRELALPGGGAGVGPGPEAQLRERARQEWVQTGAQRIAEMLRDEALTLVGRPGWFEATERALQAARVARDIREGTHRFPGEQVGPPGPDFFEQLRRERELVGPQLPPELVHQQQVFQDRSVELLGQAVAQLITIAGRPQIVIEGANLNA